MTQSIQPISPLRQRMIEDMNMRNLAPKTQSSYIRAVKKLADYLGHSPDTATAEDLRTFQLQLTDKGASRITINTTITALRFFFEVTVGERQLPRRCKRSRLTPNIWVHGLDSRWYYTPGARP